MAGRRRSRHSDSEHSERTDESENELVVEYGGNGVRSRPRIDESLRSTVVSIIKNDMQDIIHRIVQEQAEQVVTVRRPKRRTSRDRSLSRATINRGISTEDGCSNKKARVAGDFFNPDDKDSDIERWLRSIDSIGDLHQWSTIERSLYMQAKLAGAAKLWFTRLGDTDYTWDQWKDLLREAFPPRPDFGTMLREMITYCKQSTDAMSHYYHTKRMLCERCGFNGEQIVSCIILGLPEELRAGAYSLNCRTPEMLYARYLVDLESYQAPSNSTLQGFVQAVERPRQEAVEMPRREAVERPRREAVERPRRASLERPRRAPFERSRREAVRRSGSVERRRPTKNIRCYNCQELGNHFSRDCPKPQIDRCMICSGHDHNRSNCPKRRSTEKV